MNAWLISHFFNPAFVLPWGAALISAPIIIHLINRVRYRRVRFAAMEFLLQSQKQNRRRLLLEQLLLLLLRILIVVGLLLLIARLILDPSQLSVFRGVTSHHLVLLDDSGSMRNRWGETTAFDEARDVVRMLVAEGQRRPNTQKFTLLALSDPEQPLFSEREVDDAFAKELDIKLENLRCSHRTFDLGAGIDAARKLFSEEKAAIKHLHVVSDFRHGDWAKQESLSRAVRAAVDEAGIAVNLVKTVPERNANLAVTELSGDVQIAAAGVPLRLKVTLKNFSDAVAENVPLSILLDGHKLPQTIVFEKIEAGTEVEREFDVDITTPAKHRIKVALPGDALSADNFRYLAVDVPAVNKVLIIDGDPAGESGRDLVDALAPLPGLTGFAPVVEQVDYLRKHSLDDFQCLYLVNVPELPPDAVEPLEDYVTAGGGLAWFLGDAVKPAFYNDKLYLEGKGLFPVPLAAARRDLPRADDTNPGPDLDLRANLQPHPILEKSIKGQENPDIERVNIYSYIPVADDWVRDDNDRKDRVSTILRLRDKQPFMFEHQYGKGRVITCLSSISGEWNDWTKNYTFVTVQLELVKYIVPGDRTLERRTVGEPIHLSLDAAKYTENVVISSPASTGERNTPLKASPVSGKPPKQGPGKKDGGGDRSEPPSIQLVATYRDTDAPGIYKTRLVDQNKMPEEQWISYNVPIEESDLELATSELIQKRIGEDVRVQIQEPGTVDWIRKGDAGQEIRRLLLILLVIILVAEQLLAYRLSYHPKTAGAPA